MSTVRLSHNRRRDIFFKAGGACLYCGAYTPDFTIDHFIPQHEGGSEDRHNLVLSCHSCNQRKGQQDGHAYLAAACDAASQARLQAFLARIDAPHTLD